MNRKLIAIIVTGLALTAVTESAMATVNGREHNQKQRIANGLQPGGGLNLRETKKLINGQVAIRDAERAFRQNGLNNAEKRQLKTLLNAESKRIKDFRNN
jgi:hypothetical protein